VDNSLPRRQVSGDQGALGGADQAFHGGPASYTVFWHHFPAMEKCLGQRRPSLIDSGHANEPPQYDPSKPVAPPGTWWRNSLYGDALPATKIAGPAALGLISRSG